MGRGQHSQDKLYLTPSEYARSVRERAGVRGDAAGAAYAAHTLPFDHCALSLVPFVDTRAVMAPDGAVFDLLAIVPFLRAHKMHPVTGEPLSGKDLVKLHFHRNNAGVYACPVTGKTFNAHSRIVAVRTTGNVYAWEAFEELCGRGKDFRDLLTDAPCSREDIVFIQDPQDPAWIARRNVDAFFHVRKKGSASSSAPTGAAPAAVAPLVRTSESTRKVMEALKTDTSLAGMKRGREEAAEEGEHVTELGQRTSGQLAASLTSTGVSVRTRNVAAPLTDAERVAKRCKAVAALRKKAYVTLETTLGAMNLELHVDLVPRTCENFLLLARRGAYDGTLFHRVIRNFMAQGGDPTGTGRGGESAWGSKFQDEFHHKLHHDNEGIVSMANSGPDSNGSQFFITFKPASHLDRKHSVFGRVVGGLAVLREIEKVATDAQDRPKTPVSITKVTIHDDPFQDYDASVAAGGDAPTSASTRVVGGSSSAAAAVADADRWIPMPATAAHQAFALPAVGTVGAAALTATASASAPVGKYLPPAPATVHAPGPAMAEARHAAVTAPARQSFGNFDAW